jgi:hypothetical protein
LIQWSFHGHNISSDQGITTTNVGTRTSILSIGSVNHNHRGNYTCRASNLAGDRSYTAELKVNGRQQLISPETWRLQRSYRKSTKLVLGIAILLDFINYLDFSVFAIFQNFRECCHLVLATLLQMRARLHSCLVL